jgi:hypothetical protein
MTIQRQKGKQTDLSIAMQLVHEKVTAHCTDLITIRNPGASNKFISKIPCM